MGDIKSLSKNAGFTLIEVVISIAILAVIMGTAYGAITQILTAKKFLDDKRDVAITSYAIVQRLTRELQLILGDTPLIFADDKAIETQTSNSIFLLGESEGAGGSGYRDSITFLAQEGGQYLPDGGTHTGLVQISYRLAKDPEQRENDDYSLIRDEVPYITLPNSNNSQDWEKAKQKAFAQRMVYPVTDNVVSFHLNYYDLDNDKWLSAWDNSKKGTLPALIRFSVTLRSPMGNTEDYSTIVPIGAAAKKHQ